MWVTNAYCYSDGIIDFSDAFQGRSVDMAVALAFDAFFTEVQLQIAEAEAAAWEHEASVWYDGMPWLSKRQPWMATQCRKFVDLVSEE